MNLPWLVKDVILVAAHSAPLEHGWEPVALRDLIFWDDLI